MAKKNSNILGSIAFLVGVILALIAGILISFQNFIALDQDVVTMILVVLGIIVGLLNITAKEVAPFLFSGVALIISGIFGMSIMSSITGASSVLFCLLAIFIPATIIVAIKNVFILAKD